MPNPTIAPKAHSTEISARTCPANFRRPAPRAVRSANSCVRERKRADCKFATLAQAMSSIRAIATVSASNAGRALAVSSSWKGKTRKATWAPFSPMELFRASVMARASLGAASIFMPGRSRPTINRNLLLRCVSMFGVTWSGSQTPRAASLPQSSGNLSPAGSTPMML